MVEISDRVERADKDPRRGDLGTVVDIDNLAQRARIKWDKRQLRTWMKFTSLKKIS